MSTYLQPCNQCGESTSKKYAREHGGKCKACFTGEPREPRESAAERRNAMIIDHGYHAYAREEGHYG